MAKNARPSGQKRAKERARQEKQQEKAARRVEAKALKGQHQATADGEDPDLAGITPGPHNRPVGLEPDGD